jgi:hypothetical protein
MALTIRIYDDGDGHNQMAFEGIRAVRGAEGAAVYQLHRQWADAGRTTDYLLQPGGSSPGISLGPDKGTADFDPAPSAERPQKLLIESLDAHTYAMDRKELSTSGSPRRDDLDYAQFNVYCETAGTLAFQVSFPDSMSLAAEPPSVQAYQVFTAGSREREVFDSALTARASEGFFYSPLLRVAFLSVRKPQRSAYRIYWRLGQPLALADPPTPTQRALLEGRRNALLSVRNFFAGVAAGPEAIGRKQKIVDLVATIGDYVASLLKKTVAKTRADEAVLKDLLPYVEISLMAIEKGDVLRLVAGTSVADPTFWDVKMRFGEGIAGRAARLLDARTYDEEEVSGTVFAGVYVELEPGKRHAWLLAVPLWSEDCGRAAIGVLNIGIFDPTRAHMLKVLGQVTQVRELAAWANTDFLPKLLDVVSSN